MSSSSPSPSPLVLLADSDHDTVAAHALLLEAAGYSVLSCTDGKEAMALARSHRPAVFIGDVRLSQASGMDVCRALREHARTDPVLCIAVTGWLTAEGAAEAKTAGFDHILMKPDCQESLMKLLPSAQQKRS